MGADLNETTDVKRPISNVLLYDLPFDEFKNVYEADARKEIEEWLDRKKKYDEAENISKKLTEEYFKDGIPDDLPLYIQNHLRLFEDTVTPMSKIKDKLASRLKSKEIIVSDEGTETLKNKIKEVQAKQAEIIDIIIDKDKYLSDEHKNLIGFYVSEYKKLEDLKANYLDRIQAIFNGYEPGVFERHFSEPKGEIIDG